MFSKAQFALVAVLSTSLFLTSTQSARSQSEWVFTGDQLSAEDGPFSVYGYRDDLASTGVGPLGFDPKTSLAAAQKRAAEYINANANKPGVRAEVWSANEKKKMVLTLQNKPKKDF